MSFTFKQIDNTWVVWYTPAHRFMQLQKPAFRVLEDFAGNLPESQIIRNCAKEFKLPVVHARRFVKEITGQLQALGKSVSDKVVSRCAEQTNLRATESFVTKNYCISNISLRFRYGHPELEDMIHPGFSYLESKQYEVEPHYCFDIFKTEDKIVLQINGQTCWQCPGSKPDYFNGFVFTQMLNCINSTSDDFWMGAVHASAVSDGEGAILFTAPSGSGKSTFAAMLMHHGYQVLSDDFVPVSLDTPKVYPFPEGISVKNRSLHALQSLFPSLAVAGDSLPDNVYEVFLPIAREKLPDAVPVRAIVFLRFNPLIDFVLKEISNLEAMDRFLKELWLQPDARVAAQFMDWYFNIPCYTLEYSDSAKAIASLSQLFQK